MPLPPSGGYNSGYNSGKYDPDDYDSDDFSGYNSGFGQDANSGYFGSSDYDSDDYSGYQHVDRDADGYDNDGYNVDGYNVDGYDVYGFNAQGLNVNGLTREEQAAAAALLASEPSDPLQDLEPSTAELLTPADVRAETNYGLVSIPPGEGFTDSVNPFIRPESKGGIGSLAG